MNKAFGILIFTSFLIFQHPAIAVDVAPRISDREIVVGLAEIRGDIKRLEDGQMALDKGLNTRIDDLRSEMNGRFDTLQWTLGIFITLALVILGFVLRMQWQMHRRQTRMETVLEVQREEVSFIKKIIEKILPPKGVL